MRYLLRAFFAKPDIPLLRLPWNAIGVVAAAVAGWWDPSIWGVAAAGEMIYLFTLASHPGFQQYIDAERIALLRLDSEDARYKLLSRVGGAARQRYKKLEEKRQRLAQLYREHSSDDLLLDSNMESLQKLTWMYLNLLVAQRNMVLAGSSASSDSREIAAQIAQHERELAGAGSETVRHSKQATIELLRSRLDNLKTRDTTLAEIEADLARIEAQIDVAIDEATLRGRPSAISAGIELTSKMLENLEQETTYGSISETSETTTTTPQVPQ